MGEAKKWYEIIRYERELRGWTQKQVAKALATNEKRVSLWECGASKPGPRNRAKFCKLYGKNAVELGLVQQESLDEPSLAPTTSSLSRPQRDVDYSPLTASSFWNIPYLRNPFFTGREALLQHLHDLLTIEQAVALAHPQWPPHAISGLGGIGKTQTALEYAHRYRHEYEAVLWIKADTRENLLAGFLALAVLLNLVAKDEKEPHQAINAVRRWLKDHTDWLLILDNADDLTVVYDFLPTLGRGHILLTTRAGAVGRMAKRVEIDLMEPDEGTLFLLRRTGVLEPDSSLQEASSADRACASKIVQVMDGLPLALDQAGAYIEETGISLSDYLNLYQVHRSELLKRRSVLSADYPHTVATTWSLSFQQVERADAAAAELLRLCAFLDPDAIPEEMITTGGSALGPLLGPIASDQLRLNGAIEVLLRYSFIRRNPRTRMLTVHRLVQAVVQDDMGKQMQCTWAERAVRVVHQAFPSKIEIATWPQCRRCIPHAQACVALMDQYGLAFSEEAHLFNQAGYYLKEQALYAEAEPLYQRALIIREAVLGPDHLDTAQSLYNLARLYHEQGKYVEAERFHQRALAIREHLLGHEHPATAESLNSLALLYWAWGKYLEAERLYQRALPMREKVLGSEHPDTAHCLNNLALLYVSQGRYAEAETLHRRVLAIREKVLEPKHPDTAQSLQNLAGLYYAQGDQSRYAEAEQLYLRSLAIREQVLGLEHLQTAKSLHNLALLYEAQGKYTEAKPLYQRVLTIREKALGQENPKTIATVESYAALLRKLNRDAEAADLEARFKALQLRLP